MIALEGGARRMLLDLPGYSLTTKAYEGSETVLYRGRRDEDGARVAVKVTRNEYPTARELGRLRREFALLQDIDDLPGVVRAYALERCGRGVALVMEDLGASSLDDLQRARRVEVEEVLKIAVSLSGTLDSLHRRDVIHKDIKPRNIMIDEATGAPHLVDFGISARLLREAPAAMSPESLEGTLAYISPEQTGRVNRAVDLRTDLYSLGVTLFELLTGALPFPATDPTELIHSHIARAPTPPSERVKEVPQALSDVVMRLLAKMPEERYQSARGLKADLERCLSQWTASLSDPRTRSRDPRGWISPFRLGLQDRSGELRIPQRLYGREPDVEALLSAFERARIGTTELLLISGYSGVGKSALVNELHKAIARQGGAFVRGKFDPMSRGTPLAPVAYALRELVRQILTESPAGLEVWRGAILEAVGPNGRLLFDLIPELERVLGPQPDVPALGPTEAKNRFELLVQRFVRALATAEHPLALFLDDLQWADPVSLRLFGLLLGNPDMKHILLVGAYRDNEVDAAHPLVSMLDELRKTGAPLTEITLRPLDLPAVTQLLAETLGKGEHEIRALSALIFEKTQGNPFFLSQFLGAIHEQRLLAFDAASGSFVWDLARIQGAMITDNVVDLMLSKLRRLAEGTQRALTLAACIGSEFDLHTLSIIHQKSPGATAADLWGALRDGLVLPQGGDYRLLEGRSDTVDVHVSYRFQHDRVQEAAYALIPEERKEEVHLSIGRLLWARSGEPPRDEDVLEIVRHLHLSAGRIVDGVERLSAARLHLRAGRKAKTRAAYKAAADNFAVGIHLLGPEGWERDGALCFSLHVEGAECAYLSGALDRAESLFDVLLPRASSSVERARIDNLRLVLYMTLGKHTEALKAGLAGLACLGVTLPETQAELQAASASGPAEVAATLGGRRIEDLLHAPAADPEKEAAFQLLSDVLLPAYLVDPLLYPALVFKFVTLCLEHGHSDMSAFGYMAYGFMITLFLGRPAEGYAFGKLALALNEKFHNPLLAVRLPNAFGSYIYFCEPARAAFPYLATAHQSALECGDLVYLSTISFYLPLLKITAGVRLDEVRDEVERFLVLMQRTRDVTATATLSVVKQAIANLTGRTRSRSSLSDERFDEDRFLAKLDERDHRSVLFYYYALKLDIHLLHGEHEAALAAAEQAERASASAIGLHPLTRLYFSTCLLLLALPAAETPEEEGRRGAEIARHRGQIAGLAAHCPKNFQHQLLLIDAEAARRSGKHAEAMDLYDEAITLAKENEFSQDEALANELCAKMYVAIGRTRAACSYMCGAYLGYLHWGALAKAQDIEKAHGHLLSLLVGQKGRSAITSNASGAGTTTLLGQTIAGSLRDAALVVRAAQVISGEITLQKVIEHLSKIVLESAGAERGALLLEREGRLFVEATFGVEPEVLKVGLSAALDTYVDLPRSVALFVARTRERVILDDARENARFAADPYIAAGQVKSVLCLPLLHQGRLSGLLYLENKKASATSTAARVELLELLSSQAAISIENARMVADVRAANEEVRRANGRLETEIAERTEELRLSNGELSAANERLQRELAQREQGERERAALQGQMIEAQRTRLAEMATPLIPITDRIMVMPLIGTMDPERAAQVLEAALEGAARRRAQVVILDITGIRQIDTQVIHTLLQSATALRLLGAQAVLTGIRPEVAQTMVGLGIDLGVVVTRGTLQGGIAYALRLSGERPGG